MYDIVIKNGTVVDGTGEKMQQTDVAIKGDTIVKIGSLDKAKAHTIIDATDHFVTPGFIDISNRSDVYWRIFDDPMMESHLRQGITTIIGGNSGASLAPHYNEDMFLSTQKWSDIAGKNVNWHSMREFLSVVEKHRLAMNFGTFVGHGTLRRGIIGSEMRSLDNRELASLIAHARKSIQEGALGVSLGLLYTHARSANTNELRMLGRAVHAEGGLLAAHLRNEEKDVLHALDEVIDITESTGVRTHITHLKVIGKNNWPLMKPALSRIDIARADGHDITFDVYPYTQTGSVLYAFLPDWVTDGGKKMLLSRLKNKNIYDEVEKELTSHNLDLSGAIIAYQKTDTQNLKGRTLKSIAGERGVSVAKIILDILLASDGRAIVICDTLSNENVERAIKSPHALITSNSPGYTKGKTNKNLLPHPRSFGAFPHFLHEYVYKKKLLTWEEAIQKITGHVALQCCIKDRGTLEVGKKADIAVFSPRNIIGKANMDDPLLYADGISSLIVNGSRVIDEGQVTDERPGAIVRHNPS